MADHPAHRISTTAAATIGFAAAAVLGVTGWLGIRIVDNIDGDIKRLEAAVKESEARSAAKIDSVLARLDTLNSRVDRILEGQATTAAQVSQALTLANELKAKVDRVAEKVNVVLPAFPTPMVVTGAPIPSGPPVNGKKTQ